VGVTSALGGVIGVGVKPVSTPPGGGLGTGSGEFVGSGESKAAVEIADPIAVMTAITIKTNNRIFIISPS